MYGKRRVKKQKTEKQNKLKFVEDWKLQNEDRLRADTRHSPQRRAAAQRPAVLPMVAAHQSPHACISAFSAGNCLSCSTPPAAPICIDINSQPAAQAWAEVSQAAGINCHVSMVCLFLAIMLSPAARGKATLALLGREIEIYTVVCSWSHFLMVEKMAWTLRW